MLFLAIAKSKGKLIANVRETATFIEREMEKKQRNCTKNEAQKIKSNNFTRSNREKSNISNAILIIN